MEVTLKEHLEAKIDAIKEATDLAKESLEYRLEGMNEFRAQQRDIIATFARKSEVDVELRSIKKDIKSLQKIVWTGLGALAVLQFLLGFFI